MDDEEEDRSRRRKERDLYATLGVPRTASDEDIKRAYRHLAQTYHPDKHRTAGMREIAAANFNRIHEAFEILSSPQKKQIYDTYGWEGLNAGMELGPHLRTRDEIRAEFERKEREKAIRDLMEEQRKMGVEFVFGLSAQNMIDSGDILNGLDVLTTGLSSSMPLQIDKKTSTVMGGQVHNRRGLGGGTLMLGVSRQCSAVSALDASVSVGLRSALAVGGSRYLSRSGNSKGSLGFSWGPRDGSSLNVGLERKLAESVRGHWTWTVGPGGGIVTGAHGRHGVQGSVVRQINPQYQVRATAKAGTAGIFLDVGGVRKLSADCSVSMSATVGLQGVLLKHRLSYLGYKLSIPVFLVPSLRPKVVLCALLAPPLAFLALEKCVLGPVARRRQTRLRRENAKEVREALAEAARTAEVMSEAAARKLAAQEACGGLVVLRAVYGDVDAPGAWADSPPTATEAGSAAPSPARPQRPDFGAGESSAAAAAAAAAEPGAPPLAEDASLGSVAGGDDEGPFQSPRVTMGNGVMGGGPTGAGAGAGPGSSEGAGAAADGGAARRAWGPRSGSRGGLSSAVEDGDSASAAAAAAAAAAKKEEPELPPPFMDVTTAVRFLENEGEVFISADIEKSGIMGFCDVCPGEPKRLRVRYRHRGRLHEVTVADEEELSIPDDKHALLRGGGDDWR